MGTIFQDSPTYTGKGQPPPGGESRMFGLFPGSPNYEGPAGTVPVITVPPSAPSAPAAPGGGDAVPPVVLNGADDVVIVVRSRGFDCSLRVSARAVGSFARGMASVLSSQAPRLAGDCGCHDAAEAGSGGADARASAAHENEEPGTDAGGDDGDPDGGGGPPSPRRWWRG